MECDWSSDVCSSDLIGDGEEPEGFIHYEKLIEQGRPAEPEVAVDAADTWKIG
jgi:hypothetical protein